MNKLKNTFVQLINATSEFLEKFSGTIIQNDTSVFLNFLNRSLKSSRTALESGPNEKILEEAEELISRILLATPHLDNIASQLSAEQKNKLEVLYDKKDALIEELKDEQYKIVFQTNGGSKLLSLEEEDTAASNALEKVIQKIDSLETVVQNIRKESDLAIQQVQDLYKQAQNDVSDYKNEINKLRQVNATSVLSGGFETSSNTERKAANTLRILSVITMSFAVLILAYSIWESTNTAISLPVLAYRATVAILITAPAAYLARESAKHRNKQYHYQQISLELATITPYLASLPIELQNEIKGAAARTIFTKEKVIEKLDETFPINAQELILETIKSLKQVSSQAINKSSK